MEGPPPDDPSVLDSEGGAPRPVSQALPSSEQTSPSLSDSTTTYSTRMSPSISTPGPRHTHQLLSAKYTKETLPGASQSISLPPMRMAPAIQANAPSNDLFSLDFRGPLASTGSVPEPKKDIKQDILSLFSSNPVAATPIQTATTTPHNHSLNWQGNVPQQQSVPSTSMMGTTGTGMWGSSSGWTGSGSVTEPQPNIWNPPATTVQSQSNIFDTNSIWGANSTSNIMPSVPQSQWAPSNAVQKKDEAFGDIWGGFK